MRVFYPSYYKKFSCIADRCRHSCCVGWEISVDGLTMEKYAALPKEEGREILSHVGGDGCMLLAEDERCPFLCDDGLCRLISAYGEGYISHICREHPRFYHRVGDRVECGIGASCEEAARIILSSDFGDFYSAEAEGVQVAEETDFDTLTHRAYIYSVLSDGGLSFRDKLLLIGERYGVGEEAFVGDDVRLALSELELLDESHRELICAEHREGREEDRVYLERFLAYLVFRHLSVATGRENLSARVGFCLLLTRMLEGILATRPADFDTVSEYARIISEEIEYSEDNTASLIFELECLI